MHFKIITALHHPPPEWLQWTLDSIRAQEYMDYDVCIAIDQAEMSPELCGIADAHCELLGWKTYQHPGWYGSVRTQYEAIMSFCSDPEDVVVWVDGDGDKLAHPGVLNILNTFYSRGFDLTYGSQDTYPPSPTTQQARPYPAEVIAANRYRQYARFEGGICHNHLRTMKFKLIQQMDESDFKDSHGAWLQGAADSVFMFPGLELSRGNFAVIPDVLLLYHADHELSEWKTMNHFADYANHVVLAEKSPK